MQAFLFYITTRDQKGYFKFVRWKHSNSFGQDQNSEHSNFHYQSGWNRQNRFPPVDGNYSNR